jgi:PAS domain S-box-containing protein
MEKNKKSKNIDLHAHMCAKQNETQPLWQRFFRLFHSHPAPKQDSSRVQAELNFKEKIISASSSAIATCDLKGAMTYANPCFHTWWGFTDSSEFLGKPFWDFWLLGDRVDEVIRILHREGTWSGEMKARRKDGSFFDVQVAAALITDSSGTPIALTSTTVDITERKQIEESSLRRERRFKELIRNSSDSIVILDKNGIQVYVSDVVEKILGYKPAELVNIPVIDLMIHPDDKAKTQAAFNAILSEGWSRVQYRHKHKNGGWKYLEAWGTNQLENPDIRGVVVNVRDVTERRDAEEKLHFKENIIQFSSSAIATCDLEGRMTYANPHFCKLWGFSDSLEFLGKRFSNFWLVQEREEEIMRILRESSSWSGELKARKKDGTLFDVQVSAALVLDSNGKPVALTSTSVDITERIRAEEAQRESEKKFSTLFSSMTEVVVLHEMIYDEKGAALNYRILDCNQSFTDSTGIARSKALGNLATDVYKTERPPYLDEFTSVVESGIPKRFEVYFAPLNKYFDISVVSMGTNRFATVSNDISESRQAEEALKMSEERYRTIFTDSPDAYFIVIDGLFVECNRASEKMLGGSREMIIGESPASLSPEFQPDGRLSKDAAREHIEEAFQIGFTHFEWVHRRFDGPVVPMDICLAVTSFLGKTALFCTCRDMTERKRAEEDIRIFQKAVEDSTDAIGMSSPSGKHYYQNKAFTKLFGRTVEEINGKGGALSTLFADRAMGRTVFQTIMNGDEWIGEVRMLTARGCTMDVFLRAYSIKDRYGKVIALVGMHTDITERILNEEELKRELKRKQSEMETISRVALSLNLVHGEVQKFVAELTELAARVLHVERVGVWFFEDAETRLVNIDTFIASSGEHLSGTVLSEAEFYNEFSELKKAQYIDAHDVLSDARTAGYLESYLKPNSITSMLDAVIRFGGKNIGAICFESVDIPHVWKDDEITFACQLADQIALTVSHNERKKTEAELEKYRVYLEDLVLERTKALHEAQDQLVFNEKFAALGKLAGMVAHELRNPLGVIKNAVFFLRLRLAQEVQNDEKVRKHLDILDSEVVVSDRIITDILAYGRIKEPELASANLNSLVERVIRKTVIPPRIKVIVNLLPDLPCIMADENQLMLILNNIISNAIDAMPHEGTLALETRFSERTIELHIKDSGIGISAENLPKIFDPDFSNKHTGIGLGLAICHSIVKLHKGTIDVISKENVGTEFIVSLPL